MPSIRALWKVAGILLLAACGSEPRAPKPPEVGAAFSSLPLPPQAEFVSKAGSADALQITLRTPAEAGRVADYYRRLLGGANWHLISDVKNPDGSVVLYAEQNGPPLWVRIWKEGDRPGTMVQLTGAVVAKDSAKLQGGADTASKQRGSKRS
jgi:hypothetical protein